MTDADNKQELTTTEEAQGYLKRVNLLAPATMGLIITDGDSLALASEKLAGQLKPLSKELKARRKERIDLLNKSKKLVEDDYKPAIEAIDGLIDFVNGGIIRYLDEQERIAAQKQAKLDREAMDKERARLAEAAKAEEEGRKVEEPLIPEPVVELVDKVDTTLRATGGTTSMRKVPVVIIDNEALIPRKYLVVDKVLLNKDVKGGMIVPGAHLDYQSVLSTRTNG